MTATAAAVRVGHVDESDWDLYIGHANEARGLTGSPWACQFTMDPRRPNAREYMLAQYRLWLLEQDELVRQLPALRGLKIACW